MMTKKVAVIFLIWLTISIGRISAEVVDKIIVIVNCEVITQGEVDRILAPIYEQYKKMYTPDEIDSKMEEARQRVISQLIDDRLILSEAKRLNVVIDESDVDARVDEMVKQLGGKERFDEALSAQHLTLKDLKTRYREQMMVRRLVDTKVGSKVTITPVEVSEYYDKHADEFLQPEEIKLSNILIRPKNVDDAQRCADLANKILKEIRDGTGDFATLAKEYSEGPGASDGGLMGYVKSGDLLPEIEKVVFILKEGQVSDVIQTSVGYHIFKVEERRERHALSLSEARHMIEEAVFREKVREKLKGWLEGLKKNAYIAFK